MNNELFNELLESIKEAGAIMRGEKTASKTTVIKANERLSCIQRDGDCFLVKTVEFETGVIQTTITYTFLDEVKDAEKADYYHKAFNVADTLQDQHDIACKAVFTNGANMFLF
jgi:hypothetical protein